ncbi:DNA polymerase III subunit chi [Acuticoccus sp.]|uniref:DNA polymerase III subunit chi n=1 Tax=Acuticoccus sp. TaxID=1904378 RepID=UPI003B52F266
MADVLFYHLEQQTLEDVLPTLLERTLARGWRAVVETPDASRVDALDRHLWVFRDDAFLPHGRVDDNAAEHPVLLTTGPQNPNGAKVRFLVDRAAPSAVDTYERVVLIFSADDPDAVADARRHWPSLKAAGHAVTYWRQGRDGRWEKKG